MSYVKLGKETLYSNENATEENKQPHFRGEVTVNHDIPAGAKIGLAGWLNERGNKRSLFFSLSCKEEELSNDKPIEMDIDQLKDHFNK